MTVPDLSMKADLWTDYRSAFRNFSEKVRSFQVLSAQPNVCTREIQVALLAIEKARLAYSHGRNALAQQFLPSSARNALLAASEPAWVDTARVAELLWESAGRPDGTAEADWYRAEEIIRQAAGIIASNGD
jgi:hypothetical protein